MCSAEIEIICQSRNSSVRKARRAATGRPRCVARFGTIVLFFGVPLGSVIVPLGARFQLWVTGKGIPFLSIPSATPTVVFLAMQVIQDMETLKDVRRDINQFNQFLFV